MLALIDELPLALEVVYSLILLFLNNKTCRYIRARNTASVIRIKVQVLRKLGVGAIKPLVSAYW